MAIQEQRPVQIGVIGAMQRSHPALTELWFQWLDIPQLHLTEFGMGTPGEVGVLPHTSITLRPSAGSGVTWQRFCDLMAIEPDAVERRSMPIILNERHAGHKEFWKSAKKRELEDAEGPLEWWWRLLVIRQRGIRRASKVLLSSLFDDDTVSRGSPIVSFLNPSLKTEGRRASEVIDKVYASPTDMLVAFDVPLKSARQGLAISLSDAKLRARLTSSLIDLSTSRLA